MQAPAHVALLLMACVACGPPGASGDVAGGSDSSEPTPTDTAAPPDAPTQLCLEGLDACEAEARAADDACLQGCVDLDECPRGECRAQCGLESAQQLGQCAAHCAASDEDAARYACWSSCREDSIGCFSDSECDSSVCDYLHYACAIPGCDLDCFNLVVDFEYAGSCNFVLPAAIPPPMVPYTDIEIDGVLAVLLASLEECQVESGWMLSRAQLVKLLESPPRPRYEQPCRTFAEHD